MNFLMWFNLKGTAVWKWIMNKTDAYGTGIAQYDYNRELLSNPTIAAAIHSHFHLREANESDCNNITDLIRDYLLVLARNISDQHNMLNTNDTKAFSIESKLIFVLLLNKSVLT